MGRRVDDFLDDERADAAMRRVLARVSEPSQLAPPPDLVARTARRLPAEPPALAARNAARRRAIRLGLGAALAVLVALVALAGVMSAFGEARIAMLFGDGGSGLSRFLLMLQLLAKPLLRTVVAVGLPLLLGGVVVLAAAGWSWWWLLRRTPGYGYAENGP
jgi:hypothetical protein